MESVAPGVTLGLMGGRLMAGEITREEMLVQAKTLGAVGANDKIDHLIAVAKNQQERRSSLRRAYDFVVVGGGASGSVVAARLSEDPSARVLLLEAGGSDLVPPVLATEGWFFAQGTELDWSFKAEPSPAVNGRSIAQAMGRVLGGGSSINGMVWARGHVTDFDAWEKATGDAGWGSASAFRLYNEIENYHGPVEDEDRGTTGPVFVTSPASPLPIATAYLKAAQELGYQVFPQQNGALQHARQGAALTEMKIRDGARVNLAADYLYPAMDRPNLTVLTGAYVSRILIEDGVATGVEFDWGGDRRIVQANAEVIMSAGAIQTPKLLMLSGVGNRDHLAQFDIPLAAHLPGVGQNLQDHPIIGAGLWQAPEPFGLQANAGEANLFACSDDTLDAPDLHIFHIEGPYLSDATMRYYADNVFSITPGLVRPHSRGFLQLRSNDPKAAPVIHANMLTDERDMVAIRKGMEIARALGNSTAMRSFVAKEILPGDRTGDDLDTLIRDGAMSMHHPTCTARMGLDDDAVLDPQLRVRGIDRLRVADGSAMPSITTGNTQAPCVLIAERLSEILRADAGSYNEARAELSASVDA